MATDQLIATLVGEQAAAWQIPPSVARDIAVPSQIGDGLAGPRNVQHLMIARDAIPIAADELAYQRSLGMEVTARHRAGRYFFLRPEMQVGGPGLSPELPGLPLQPGLPGPRRPQIPATQYHGIPPTQVLPPAQTVYYTATPQVGYNW